MTTTTISREDLTTPPHGPEADKVEHHRQRGRRTNPAQSQARRDTVLPARFGPAELTSMGSSAPAPPAHRPAGGAGAPSSASQAKPHTVAHGKSNESFRTSRTEGPTV